MSRRPADQFDYVFAKPSEPNRGTSYKYIWGRGTWRLPPDVKPLRVFLGVSFWLSLAAFPVWIWPMIRGAKPEAEKGPPNIYAVIKEKNREDRSTIGRKVGGEPTHTPPRTTPPPYGAHVHAHTTAQRSGAH